MAFRTLGCKVNRVESEAIAAELIGKGAVVADEDRASVVVINTCTVTGEADTKARKAVRQALRAPGNPVVVVTGCLAALDADGLRALGRRVVVESDKALVAQRVGEVLDLACGTPALQAPVSGKRARAGLRTRAMLKVEDGCDNFCTYCIVPYARGVPRAVPLERAVADARLLVEAGVNEIVLTGINIGRYADGDADLAALIAAIAATGIARLRLSSIEPPDLTPRLLSVLAETPAVCEHLHVPLQSGSDAVLRAMARTYSVEGFRRIIADVRSAIPGVAITSDLIAGFPAETHIDHEATVALVEDVGFAKLHVFRYSERAGTPAAQMAQVAPELRADRASELRSVGDRLRYRYEEQRIGHEAEVLVEQTDERGGLGTSRDYLRVQVATPAGGVGDIVQVILARGSAGQVIGEPMI